MKRILISIFALLLSLPAYAQKPDWIPLAQLLGEGLQEDELSKVILSINRCSALYFSLSRITEIDTPDIASGWDAQSLKMLTASQIASVVLASQRGNNDIDLDALSDRSVNAVFALYELYNMWLDNNYLMNGSYFGTDVEFQLEMETCSLVSVVADQFLEM